MKGLMRLPPSSKKMRMKIDRWKLEHGTLDERIKQTYILSREDIDRDRSIVDALRNNLSSEDEDLLEISIMRLGIRAKDVSSIDKIMNILRNNDEYLVRSASIAALSSLYRMIKERDEGRAAELINAVRNLCSNEGERKQVEKQFMR